MNIDISKEEYRHLLDVLQMAEWVMHAHETETGPNTEPYDKVIQKFYALAKDMGQEHMVEYDLKLKKFFLSREFGQTSPSGELIDEFTDETFWDELIHRLMDRDIARTVGGYDQLDALNMTERFVHEGPIMARYIQEFDDHGLDRLEIVESFGQITAHGLTTHD
jgi:hypothetical protein